LSMPSFSGEFIFELTSGSVFMGIDPHRLARRAHNLPYTKNFPILQ
jgi:hypothetical protein